MPWWPLTLVKRLVLGVPLTPAQGDQNWTDLEGAVNDLNTRLGVALNTDGTLKAGAINNSNVFAAGVVPIAALGASAKLPVGTIIGTTNSALGTGSDEFLYCDGAAVSRTTYAALFAILNAMGLPHGAGDAVSTFNLPDYRGLTLIGTSPGGLGVLRPSARTIGAEKTLAIGAETVQLSIAELPVHDHSISGRNYLAGGSQASKKVIVEAAKWVGGSETTPTETAGSGTSHLNVQPSGVTRWLIKY